MRIDAAQRKLSHSNGERLMAPGYGFVSHADWLRRYCNTVLRNGAHFCTSATTICGGSGKSARLRPRMEYIWFDSWTTRDDQASSFSGALHDFDESCVRLLVSIKSLG